MTSCSSSLWSLAMSLWTFQLCALERKSTWFITLSRGGRSATLRSSKRCFSAVIGVAQAGRRFILVQASFWCSDGRAPRNSVKGGTSSLVSQPHCGWRLRSSSEAVSAATNLMLEAMCMKLESCKWYCWSKHVTSVFDFSRTTASV